ncbi:hypothetical protein FACS189483_08020 [Spirochaetia bacterium]|nr:hypothetical protein FACS189483_08020 [Spirochaetia bacterium]
MLSVFNKVTGAAMPVTPPRSFGLKLSFLIALITALVIIACDNGTTTTPDTTAPAEVGGLNATPGNKQVYLSWTDPADSDFAKVVITYTNGTAQSVDVAMGTEFAIISGLTNGTAYTFTVKTVNTSGNSSAGTPVTATLPHREVSSLIATAGNKEVVLTWTDPTSSDFENVVISFTPTATDVTQPVTVAKGIKTATISGLTNDTEYTFTVKAVDTSGNTSAGTPITATPAQGEVSDLIAVPGSPGEVVLTWTDPTDSDFANVVITYTNGTAQSVEVAKGTETATITGLTGGTEYPFTVKTVNTSGNSSAGTTITATTVTVEVSSLIATAGNNEVVLTWTDPTDSGFSKAVITYTNGTAQSVEVAKGTETATITGLTGGTEYTFTVKTVNTSGNSSAGTTATATPYTTYSVTTDGVSYNTTTTKIDFVFDEAVSGLTAGDITIGGTPGAATPGSLSGSGTNWSLTLTVSKAGAATVAINKVGIESGAKNIRLHTTIAAAADNGTAASPSIAAKFGIDVTPATNSAATVTEVFTALHAYLATSPTVTGSGTSLKLGDIALGNYIDLPSLNVAGYPNDDYDLAYTPNPGRYGKITATDAALSGDHGRLLRLIVVGINSFNAQGSYVGAPNASEAPRHLVFQFQNVPGTHRMNNTSPFVGGYAGSEMRQYLVPVAGKAGSGKFLTGLTAAGVPEDVLWAPSREVWTGFLSSGGSPSTTVDTIADKLFLPTEWEMLGSRSYSHATYETTANQGRFEYYAIANSTRKYGSGDTQLAYWEASPHGTNSQYFCNVTATGTLGYNMPDMAVGCVPAFCVK